MSKKHAAPKAKKNKFAVKHGAVPPSSQVTLFNEDDWEELVLEAARQRTETGTLVYAVVKRLGGAGDGGRDEPHRDSRRLFGLRVANKTLPMSGRR